MLSNGNMTRQKPCWFQAFVLCLNHTLTAHTGLWPPITLLQCGPSKWTFVPSVSLWRPAAKEAKLNLSWRSVFPCRIAHAWSSSPPISVFRYSSSKLALHSCPALRVMICSSCKRSRRRFVRWRCTQSTAFYSSFSPRYGARQRRQLRWNPTFQPG